MTNLAIVGAGIGGCSTAYFAQKYLTNTKVTVFDSQQQIGGRILSQKAYDINLENWVPHFSMEPIEPFWN